MQAIPDIDVLIDEMQLAYDLVEYSDDEARDERGRWTSGGGSGQDSPQAPDPNKPLKFLKEGAGRYTYTYPDGTQAVIAQNTERGSSWYGKWMVKRVTASGHILGYSDPIPTPLS